jgi:hypothetical protein
MTIIHKLRNIFAGVALAAALTTAHAQLGVSVAIAPPAIPEYDQPPIPGDGYIWTPGYWAYGDSGYYWVDGAWVYPPYVGGLWTPGWWGGGYGGYFWHAGYWGRNIGYYGGINYGFGYFGTGFYGGYWNGGRFFYNRAYGNFGGNFRGAFYNRPYGGFHGRPGGGASFNAHPPAQFAGRSSSAGQSNGFRGSGFRGGTAPASRNFQAAPASQQRMGGNYNSGASSYHANAPTGGARSGGYNGGGGQSRGATGGGGGGFHGGNSGGGGGSHGGGGRR